MLIETVTVQEAELMQVRRNLREKISRTDPQRTGKTTAATSGSSESETFRSLCELEKNLAEYEKIEPGEAPEVQSVLVKISEKFRNVPPEVMYQVVTGLAQQLLPFGCTMGTISDHHEYMVLLPGGKKMLVIAHIELFVKLPEVDAVAFAQELQIATELKMFREHNIEPELTMELIEKEFPGIDIRYIYYFLKTYKEENFEEVLEFLREIVRRGKVLFEHDYLALTKLAAMENKEVEQNRNQEEPEQDRVDDEGYDLADDW